MSSLSLSGAILASIFEVECAEGRDPNKFVENFVLLISEGPNAELSQLATPNSKKFRALHAFMVSIKKSTKNSLLKMTLEAVDSLSDYCEESRRGKLGAVLALGSLSSSVEIVLVNFTNTIVLPKQVLLQKLGEHGV